MVTGYSLDEYTGITKSMSYIPLGDQYVPVVCWWERGVDEVIHINFPFTQVAGFLQNEALLGKPLDGDTKYQAMIPFGNDVSVLATVEVRNELGWITIRDVQLKEVFSLNLHFDPTLTALDLPGEDALNLQISWIKLAQPVLKSITIAGKVIENPMPRIINTSGKTNTVRIEERIQVNEREYTACFLRQGRAVRLMINKAED